MNELSLSVKKTIHAPIEEVFDAWLNPKTLSKFMLPMKGMPEPDVVTDPRQGGKFTIIMNPGDKALPHSGEYLIIDRPNKISFTWESDHSIEGSTVTLEFAAHDKDSTEVRLTQVKFFDAQARDDHEGGWTCILETLVKVVSHD